MALLLLSSAIVLSFAASDLDPMLLPAQKVPAGHDQDEWPRHAVGFERQRGSYGGGSRFALVFVSTLAPL